MKKHIHILALLTGLSIIFSYSSLAQHVYYVQDIAYNKNANDSNAGTDINYPWATWKKAFETPQAGDTVYFRGGSWYPTRGLNIDPEDGIGHNGTYDNHIVFINYQNEKPIRNCINYTTTSPTAGVNIIHQTYVEYIGLTITKLNQHVENQWLNGWGFTYCGNIWLRELTACYTMGAGFRINDYDSLYMYNCDSYENADSYTTGGGEGPHLGGHADGYTISSKGLATDLYKVTHIEDCRAWHNSDDGFDIGSSKQIYMIGCWSWGNGKYDGDGNGFKYSYSCVPRSQRITRNCIAAYNKSGDGEYGGGYAVVNLYDSTFSARMTYINDVSYQDYGSWRSSDSYCDCVDFPGAADDYMANCIAYNPQDYDAAHKVCDYTNGDPSYVVIDSCSWQLFSIYGNTKLNPSYDITDDDFVSLDTTQLSAPRKTGGSLPDITFMKLKAGSDLIDGGIDVGLPYNGSAPDLGWAEYDSKNESDNLIPRIKITSPSAGNIFKEQDTILIKVDASDTDGNITKVEFYSNNIKIGESNAEPWSFIWGDAPLGVILLKATATDNEDAKATSGTISITKEEMRKIEITNYSPNPTSGSVTIVYYAPQTTTVNISVVNSSGAEVRSQTHNATKGENNQVNVDLSGLATGTYSIRLNDGTSSDSCTVTKQDDVPVRGLEILSYTTETYDLFKVSFYSPANNSISIEVFNSSGSRVVNSSFSAVEGNNETNISLAGLPAGEYRFTLNDGATTVSRYVTKMEEESYSFEKLSSSPDPTVDLFAIEFNCPADMTLPVKVLDEAGRTVLQEEFQAKKGFNKYVVNLSSLKSGNYEILLGEGSDKISATVTKQQYFNE